VQLETKSAIPIVTTKAANITIPICVQWTRPKKAEHWLEDVDF